MLMVMPADIRDTIQQAYCVPGYESSTYKNLIYIYLFRMTNEVKVTPARFRMVFLCIVMGLHACKGRNMRNTDTAQQSSVVYG